MPRVPLNIFLFFCNTLFTLRWVSPSTTSGTCVFSYFASRILVAKHLSQSWPKCLSVLLALCRRAYVLAHCGNTRVRVPVLLIGLTLIISIIWLYHWLTWVTCVYGCTGRTKQFIRPKCNGRRCLCMTLTDNTWANRCVMIDRRGKQQIVDESRHHRSRMALWLR
jgi:hypothetical protein